MITFAAKMKTFSELGLSDALLSAIAEQGYETPMPIQEEVIPWLTEADVDNQHSDLIALAQTGTGKTAAYGLPLLQLLSSEENLGRGPAGLLTLSASYFHSGGIWRCWYRTSDACSPAWCGHRGGYARKTHGPDEPWSGRSLPRALCCPR